MTQHHDDGDTGHGPGGATDWWHPRSVLTPPACALAALVVAFLTLSGQNLLLVGIQALFGEGFWTGSNVAGYYLVWGLATTVPLLVVWLLARVALSEAHDPVPSAGWQGHAARAAVVVAAVAAAGAVLTALGGILHGSLG